MKKTLILCLLLVVACVSVAIAAGPPRWVQAATPAGPHKLYASVPGDQGKCTYFQITAVSANLTFSLHNYDNNSRGTSDNAWRNIMWSDTGATGVAYGDTNLTVFMGETVSFTFDGSLTPQAYYTTGGTARVWAK